MVVSHGRHRHNAGVFWSIDFDPYFIFFQVICIFESNLKFYLKVFGDKNEVNLK